MNSIIEPVRRSINRLSLFISSSDLKKHSIIFVYPNNKSTRIYPSQYFSKCKNGIVYNDLYYIVKILQIFAIFPVKPVGNGSFRFSKLLFAYSLLIFIAVFVLVFYVLMNKVKIKKSEERFEDVVVEYLLQIYLVPIVTFPIHWNESRNLAAMLSKWYTFEDLYRKIIGIKITINKKKRYTIITFGLLLFSIGIMFAMHITLTDFEPIKVIPYCYFNVTTYIFGAFSYLYLDAIKSVTLQLQKDFQRCLKNIGPSYIPAELKLLYMSLNELLQQFSISLSYSLIFLFLFLFVTLILSIYGLLSQLAEGIKLKDVPHAITAIMALAVLYFTCEAAEKASSNLKRNFQNPLILLETYWMRPQAKKEIRSFLRATIMNKSDVNINGFFVINRRLFVSLMGTMSTYLIVLLQFQIIVPESLTTFGNFSNSTYGY